MGPSDARAVTGQRCPQNATPIKRSRDCHFFLQFLKKLKAADIPPPSGYWMKIILGKLVERTHLEGYPADLSSI